MKEKEKLLSSDTFYKAPINPYVLKRIKEEQAEREAAGIINFTTGDGSLHKLTDEEKESIIEAMGNLDTNYLPDEKATQKHNFKIEKNIHAVGHDLMSLYNDKYFLPRGVMKLFQAILDGEEEGIFKYQTKSTPTVYLDDDSTEEKENTTLKIFHEMWKNYEQSQNFRNAEIGELFNFYLEKHNIDFEILICKELFNKNFFDMHFYNQEFIIDYVRQVADEVGLLHNQKAILDEFLSNKVRFQDITDNTTRKAQTIKLTLKRIAKKLNENAK